MKNKVREFIEPSNKEKQDLWEEAIFVFDTNVLLNLYRYSAKTRDALLNAFDSLKERVWIPYQVAYEYMNKRCEVIYETVYRYDQFRKEIEMFASKAISTLRLTPKDEEITELNKYLYKWLESNKDNNLLVLKTDEDEILEKIISIFDGRVGEIIDEDELKKIKEEGEKRFKSCIPPGYKDVTKKNESDDNNAYGDLIIWKQIIQYSKDNNKGVIYITHDQKEDWWNIVKGKTIGPRFELRREFYKETNQKFHMYTMSSFIEAYNRTNEKAKIIDESAVAEVRDYDSGLSKIKKKKARENQYSIAEEISRVENTLDKLENRIERRNKVIQGIEEKYNNKGIEMPDSVRIQYSNTINTLNELQRNYYQMLERLDVLKRTYDMSEKF